MHPTYRLDEDYPILGKEVEIALNSSTSTLYTGEFPNGKYLSMYFKEEQEHFIQISKRIKLRISCINNEIKGIKMTTFNDTKQVGEITLSSFSLGQICDFLELIKNLEIAELSDKKIKFNQNSNEDCQSSIASLINKTLENSQQTELIKDLLKNELITDQDIVNTGFRKKSLQKFEKLLDDKENYLEAYKIENDISKASPEKVWQHFFKNNQWIFGYGLDYRFQSILQDEADLNTSNLDGKNTVNGDFLLADNKFTSFIEIKRPDTKLFGDKKNRSNCWKLSTDLYEAHSQILEHKASGQIKLQMNSINYDNQDNLVNQKAYDSKTILIIGNWSELNTDSPRTKAIKEKTLELFRQNSKNVEIITFDELYDRAKFIVEHK